MMSPSRILVIQSTNIEMVVTAPQLPAPGQTVLGGAFRMTPGGKGANQAVAAVDTVGAGDCFSATLGVALVEGRPLREALQFAIAVTQRPSTRNQLLLASIAE